MSWSVTTLTQRFEVARGKLKVTDTARFVTVHKTEAEARKVYAQEIDDYRNLMAGRTHDVLEQEETTVFKWWPREKVEAKAYITVKEEEDGES